MTPLIFASLRAAHVLAGAFWLGTMLLNAGWLLPATRAAGPAGGQVMREIVQVRRLPLFLNLAVVIVLGTGAVLFWWVSGGFAPAWLASGPGIAFSLGGTLTIAAALLGQFVNAPTARRFGRLAAEARTSGGSPPAQTVAEMARLQSRLLGATRLAAILLALATVAMAVARYCL